MMETIAGRVGKAAQMQTTMRAGNRRQAYTRPLNGMIKAASYVCFPEGPFGGTLSASVTLLTDRRFVLFAFGQN